MSPVGAVNVVSQRRERRQSKISLIFGKISHILPKLRLIFATDGIDSADWRH